MNYIVHIKSNKKRTTSMTNKDSLQPFEKNESIDSIGMSQLMDDLQLIINSTKVRVASVANAELTMMYWHIGKRINSEILGNQRAEYGKQIVSTLSTQLQCLYGNKGMESRLCRRCRHNYSVSMATRDLRLVASGV